MLHHIKQCHTEVTGLMHDQQQFKGTGTQILPCRCSVNIRNPLTDLRDYFQLLPRRFVSISLQVPFTAFALSPSRPRSCHGEDIPGSCRLTRTVRREPVQDQGRGLQCMSPGCKGFPGSKKGSRLKRC